MPDQIGPSGTYAGPTYYDRPSLKAAPFNKVTVGAYIFIAGLSGAAQMISAIADFVSSPRAQGTVRRGRYLSLLAPTVGAGLLVYDLHTPQRFYNMLRIFRPTSPMSIGTYFLTGFGVFGGLTAAMQMLADLFGLRRRSIAHRVARVTQVPAAAAGACIASYTAALLSATSTPSWAAAPVPLAMRFGSSSVAAGAAALSLAERRAGGDRHMAGALDAIALVALAVELGAAMAAEEKYKEIGLTAESGPWGMADRTFSGGLGNVLPLGLYAMSLLAGRRGGRLSRLASLATMAGSMAMRVTVLGTGAESARRPADNFALAQKRNLPRVV